MECIQPPGSSPNPHIHFIKTVPIASQLSNKKTFLLKVRILYKTHGRNGLTGSPLSLSKKMLMVVPNHIFLSKSH